MQPLLGRDATPDQTGPAGALVNDERDRQSEVVGVQSGGVSPRAAADYDDVVQPLPFGVTAGPSLVVLGVTLPQPMQTRWLLIASAVLAFVIIGAAAIWFLVGYI
jgi:hypothetical protein